MNILKKSTCMAIPLCILFLVAPRIYGKTSFSENSIVMQKCSACHKLDKQGRIEVIEETRKTLEEWKYVVGRMIRLNDAPLEDENFNPVIKELSRYLSLSPEEMSQIAYINSDENSQYREIPKSDLEKRLYRACVRCHTWGKIASHRNTPMQWSEIRIMHLAYYPTAVFQMREMNWPKEFKELLEPLSRLFPFENSEWREWMKKRINPDLSGEWKVAGYQPGFGYYTGTYTFSPDPEKGKDEYAIEKQIRYENGKSLAFKGTGILYGGYHLRFAMASSDSGVQTEGVFDLNAAEMGFKGKWWEVIQDKNVFGNEKFCKIDGKFNIIAAFPQSLKAGSGGLQDLRLIGINFDRNIQPSDITFSDSGITTNRIKETDATEIVIAVAVNKQVATGPVKISIRGIPYENPIIVFDNIDGIKILPEIGRARVSSGPAYPPQGIQYVARAVNFGKDGKPDTPDDLILEPVNVRWWLEEEDTSVSILMKGLRLAGVYPKFGRDKDDDLKYLKTSVNNGLYIPVTTYGPIKERVQHTQGTGLIAIGAAYRSEANEYKGRSLLAVTVPDFIPQIK